MFVDENGVRINLGERISEVLDISGDNVISSADLDMAKSLPPDAYALFEENMEELIESIVNINHGAYNHERTVDLLADFYVGRNASENRGAVYGLDMQNYDMAFDAKIKEKNKGLENTERAKFFSKTYNKNFYLDEYNAYERTIDRVKSKQNVQDIYNRSWEYIGNNVYTTEIYDKNGVWLSTERKTSVELLRDPDLFGDMYEYIDLKYPNDPFLKGSEKLDVDNKFFTINDTFNYNNKQYAAEQFVDMSAQEIANVILTAYGVFDETIKMQKGNEKIITVQNNIMYLKHSKAKGGAYNKVQIKVPKTIEDVKEMLELMGGSPILNGQIFED